VRLGPIPRFAQSPAIDDVPHKINRQRIIVAQEVEEIIRLAAPRAEMDIGDPDRTIPQWGGDEDIVQDVIHGVS
jgi:hypothetical protein